MAALNVQTCARAAAAAAIVQVMTMIIIITAGVVVSYVAVGSWQSVGVGIKSGEYGATKLQLCSSLLFFIIYSRLLYFTASIKKC